jgi:hypothetical protein
VPSERTTVTELGTALGMLGLSSVDEAVKSRTPVMWNLSPETWDQLSKLRAGGAFDPEFHAGWENGRAFLAAGDGLRGRTPLVVEWKGTGRAPGDEVAPIDLRVDHVYLVSCKYLSNILHNVAPTHLFDSLLVAARHRGNRARRDAASLAGDWYADVAPDAYQALYDGVLRVVGDWDNAVGMVGPVTTGVPAAGMSPERRGAVSLPGLERDAGNADDEASSAGAEGSSGVVGLRGAGPRPRALTAPPAVLRNLPAQAVDLSTTQREALGSWLRPGWPPGVRDAYAALSAQVSRQSVRRWEAAMAAGGGNGEAMLWRLLRMGSAPYFVLGSSATRSLRLRIATPWDWRQRFALVSMSMTDQAGGQPRVGWEALVRDRSSNEQHEVSGHIEVRWSHGRFGAPPEAKCYLDTPHHQVPGYFSLR